MSRNFELLHLAGRLQEMLEPNVVAAEPQSIPEADLGPSTPALDVAGPVREEIAKLALNLFMLPGVQGPRQVVLAGMEAGTGCSWMCARLGEVLASQTNGSVCVVDCNLRSPGLHQEFAVDNHFGLSDALLQTDPLHQYVRQLSRRNLWLLSCGSATDNCQEKMGSEKMKLRLKELRAGFDYVLLDVAPINTCNDGIVLGGASDGVVLVLKANSTRREAAQKALQQLNAANIPILGAVLNQRTFPIPDRIYNWF
ncbi:MAG: CpsD/CapB family tyrosine-protein kinase [Terriglobales bacterium]